MSATILLDFILVLRLALTATLYVFLGWALWVLYQDLREAKLASKQPPPLSLRLEQASGEQIHHFSSAQVTIGRDPTCECWLDEKTISSRHTHLVFHHGQWWVEDLRSKNGTMLNGAPVTGAVVLTSGDRLQCGGCHLSVTIGREPVSYDRENSE